ncbi:MAG: ice-binding family protein [Patescibacteria group bacterium]|jgi:uncharacterized repeat protein (TIGR01451 family)
MKKISKISAVVLVAAFTLGLSGLTAVQAAATLPVLGAAASFSILANTAITNSPTSVISGDVGLNAAGTNYSGLTTAEVAGTIYDTNGTGPDGPTAILSPSVQADASAAFTTGIPSQPLTSNQGPVLDGLVLSSGVYDIGAGRLNGGILTLDGPGVYIFRASSDLISSGSINLINGARACDVFWRVETLATINGSSFVGTILAGTGIHFGANVTLDGRALAVGGDVTLLSDTITGPTCASSGSSSIRTGTINVVKVVINDNGGTKTVADFPLFVSDEPVVSGVTNTFRAPAGVYVVTETANPNYTRTFSGDCDASGYVNLSPGENKFCIVTNNDIGSPVVAPPVPPLIDVVKVPNPLALPGGSGLVEYTYTLRNIGTVPVTDITMIGDTCSPIKLISGDMNNNSKLEVNETWKYTCSTTLTETHTNTVVTTGWANGLSAVDIASAHVIVGLPIVPPLIHVTKVPKPLALLAGGGWVTYTEKITNPGTVALSNVTLTDDKCSPMKYISGDINGDSKLDTTETWVYTCQSNLAVTTTNTAIATGEANGLIARDLAIATVVVATAVPALPNTGLAPEGNILWLMLAGALGLISVALVMILKKRA